MKARSWLAFAAIGVVAAAGARAHELSVTECQEGSDFIRNAALSRDEGLSRDEFISRMHGDIALIQAFPPDLRWFVQDEDDERLLIGAAEQVFDAPREPQAHGDEFLRSCFAQIERVSRR